jgi:hypothetical protein
MCADSDASAFCEESGPSFARMHLGHRDFLLVRAVVALGGLLVVLVYLSSRPTPLSPDRASWRLTPGVANSEVTQQTIGSTICVSGWSSSIRPDTGYTNELTLKQMQEYGRTGDPSDYQEDHLISLELGGDPTDPRNLWPEPRPFAEDVDRTENELHDAICSGKLSLAEAQRRITVLKHTRG